MKKNHVQSRQLIIILSVLTSAFISLFLNGKIIAIPYGTEKGGVIAATGVAIVIIFMALIGLLFHRFSERKN